MNLWDRQRNEQGELEPGMWFHRFEVDYKTQGPERSLLGATNAWRAKKSQRKRNHVPGAWLKAFKEWHWKSRAEAWDEYQRAIRLIAEQEAIDDMNKRHINISLGLQQAGLTTLRRLTKELKPRVDKGGKPLPPLRELTTQEIRHYLKEGIDLERLTRGLPGGEDGKTVQIVFKTQPGGIAEEMREDDDAV